MVDFQL